MVSELKIIMYGQGAHNTIVYVDDQPIGLIQNIVFNAAAGIDNPSVEIVFPNLFSNKIHNSYYKQTGSARLVKQLAEHMRQLSKVPNVTVTLQEIF